MRPSLVELLIELFWGDFFFPSVCKESNPGELANLQLDVSLQVTWNLLCSPGWPPSISVSPFCKTHEMMLRLKQEGLACLAFTPQSLLPTLLLGGR